jgi:hypothetical protein
MTAAPQLYSDYSAGVVRQLELLAIRSGELGDRVAAGKIGFLDAVDMAYSAAVWSGLVDNAGDDAVQAVLAAAFVSRG